MSGVYTNIKFSQNAIAEFLDIYGNERIFVISDSVLKDKPEFSLLKKFSEIIWFDATNSEPRTTDVDTIRQQISQLPLVPDIILGIGGGSTMDLAKAGAVLATNAGPSEKYQGWGYNLNIGIKCVTIPTLAGTGAEISPIAVLKSPHKKLGINHPCVAPIQTIIDFSLTQSVSVNNKFFTLMDCFAHNYEIARSQTSSIFAVTIAKAGLGLCRDILSSNELSEPTLLSAEKAAAASLIGGLGTAGGRVGACHAISYGPSSLSPIKHGESVTLAMLALKEIYSDIYQEVGHYLSANKVRLPRIQDFDLRKGDIDGMTAVAMKMDLLWQSHYGEQWPQFVNPKSIAKVYEKMFDA
jgi:3-deoxy-alpha-D-manno-octulosonate 8-oxidase